MKHSLCNRLLSRPLRVTSVYSFSRCNREPAKMACVAQPTPSCVAANPSSSAHWSRPGRRRSSVTARCQRRRARTHSSLSRRTCRNTGSKPLLSTLMALLGASSSISMHSSTFLKLYYPASPFVHLFDLPVCQHSFTHTHTLTHTHTHTHIHTHTHTTPSTTP